MVDSSFAEEIQNPNSPCKEKLRISGFDRWNSTFLRWLTPLQTNEGSFVATIDSVTGEHQLELLANHTFGYDGLVNSWKNKSTGSVSSSMERIYIESLLLYLQLPLMIGDGKQQTILPSEIIRDKTYHRMFFMLEEGDTKDPQKDHYVGYWNTETNLLEYMLFTYRDLYASYKGTLFFSDYQEMSGIRYPTSIAIQNSITSAKDVHRIHVKKLQCVSN